MFDLKREPTHPGDVLKYDFLDESEYIADPACQ